MTDENGMNEEMLLNEEQEVPEIAAEESIEETLRRTYDELAEKKAQDANQEEAGSKSQEATAPSSEEASKAAATLARSRGKKKVVEAKDLDVGNKASARIEPPSRFPLEKKEFFNKLPREMQEEISKSWGDIESGVTKIVQDLSREKSRYAEVNQIVDHYLPQWGLNNLTPSQAVAELCAAQDYILKDPLSAYQIMLAKSGLTPEDLIAARDGGYAPAAPVYQQQQQLGLTDVRQVVYNTLAEAQEQQAIQAGAQELAQLKNEVGADGRYVWPELHDFNQTQRVRTLVEDLRKTQPLPLAEATKRAINTIRILDGNIGSPSPTISPRPLPTAGNQLQRLKAASVSVKGRGNPSVSLNGEAPQHETIEQTLRRTMASMGVIN